ncbi:MAG: biotin/lipoyl-binding protein, partial [Thermoflexales bacterium]|nr:biotin/lipoyl-binding protein [Thermoflexales bacterium]
MTKQRAIWLALGIMVMSLAACTANPIAPKPTPTRAAGTESYAQPAAGNITANGVLQPAQQVQLGFSVGGRVESVEAELGELVKSGQVLAALDDTELQRAAAGAKLELESAQARLGQLQAQATPVPEHVMAATAAISSAQTALVQAHA